MISVFGVLVLYQTDRSYCLPGVTFGAHAGDSSIMALRSPSTRRGIAICIALVPP